MMKQVRTAVSLLAFFTVITGMLYPAAVTVLAQLLFPAEANGSIILRDGVPAGSSLIGQPFSDPKYFWGRPSATAAHPYNAGASSGSNYGPLHPALLAAARQRAADLRAADPDNERPIPADLVTASGSGLDPHISVAAAMYQLPRVARVRGMKHETLYGLIARHTDGRQFGFLGEPAVNVLELNMALDALTNGHGGSR